MIQLLKNIFGFGPRVDFAELMKQGAVVVDVRSRSEFSGGHVKGSLNIPVDELSSNLKKLKEKDQPIITCCASGMRSGVAKNILRSAGYTRVYNGGSWQSVNSKI